MLVEKFNSKMMVRVYILCFLSFWAINSWGQEYNAQDSLSKTDSIPEQKPMQDSIPVSFMKQLDRYYTDWYFSKRDSVNYADSAFIMERLKSLRVA